MMKPQLLVAATSSGSGKTVFTIGLLRALRNRGMRVAPFKCGPDYIDTQFHRMAAGRESVNLDLWMASESHVCQVYAHYGAEADVCVTEGVMGAFDGWNKMEGSSASLAKALRVPVILLVNARSSAYSVAPLVYGFKHFDPEVEVVGVVFNRVASASHLSFLKAACEDVGVECLGCLPIDDGLVVPSRHLGLAVDADLSIEPLIVRAAALVEKNVDVYKLLYICTRARAVAEPFPSQGFRNMKIAVARDAAFNFVYKENMDRLSGWGTVTCFSPLEDTRLPEADLLYLPGGYPELFAEDLQANRDMREQIRRYAESGGKVWAECGGMMYLTRSLAMEGTTYTMAGVLPLDSTMKEARLHLGYRRIMYGGMELRGHEFHYSRLVTPDALPTVARQYNARGTEASTSLYRYKNVLASYTHLYWGETELPALWESFPDGL